MKAISNNQNFLLEQAKNGDIDAFAELFEEHRRFVFTLALRLAGTNDSEDVVMDTFLKAWKALPGFQQRSSLKTWLARITRNCALDFRRRTSRRSSRESALINAEGESEIDQLADPVYRDPAGEAVNRELKQAIDTAISQLSEEQRITVVMREVDGLSYREIAAATNVGVGTVMSRLFYGKRKLRQLLQEQLP